MKLNDIQGISWGVLNLSTSENITCIINLCKGMEEFLLLAHDRKSLYTDEKCDMEEVSYLENY